jgi:hypothetical protein
VLQVMHAAVVSHQGVVGGGVAHSDP